MGKVIKTVGTALTFVGLAVATVATAGAAGVGFAAVAAGAVSTAVGASIATIVTTLAVGGLALQTIGGAMQGGQRLEDSGANARGQAYVDPNALGAYVFGETAAPSVVVFEQNHGEEKELISTVFAHAWHEIEGFVSLHVDGEPVSFSGESAVGEYAGILSWKRKTGAPDQFAIHLPGTVWPGTARGAGMAHSAMVWNFKDQDKLTGGVPNRLVARVRGAMLYDPRLDSAVGGAGPQRFDNPATWTWNNGNAALVALRYMIGERAPDGKVIWGVGETLDDIDIDSVIAAANVADEIRDGKPRFRLGGFYPTSNDHESFFAQWEASTGGKVARIGGRRFIWLPHNDLAPVGTIEDRHILREAGISLRAGQEPEVLVNTARGRFIDPDELYQGAPYPEIEEPDALADDGRPRVLPLDFPWVQDVEIAERNARYAIRRSRYGRVWRFAMGWAGALYHPFAVVALNIRETVGETLLARVIDRQMSTAGVVILTLQEENPAIYDDTLPLGITPSTVPPPDRLDRLGTVTSRWGLVRERPVELTDGRVGKGLNPDGSVADGKTTNAALANDMRNHLAWLAERTREIEEEAQNLHRLVGEMQLEDWDNRERIRRELKVEADNLRAGYREEIIAATSAGSAIAGRLEVIETEINDPQTGLLALGMGQSALSTRVDNAEGAVAVNASDIVSLQSSLTLALDEIDANASAIGGLDTRVVNAEGIITVQAAQIASLSSDITSAEGDIAANASAVSSLDTRVASVEDDVTAQASALIGVNAATGGNVANARFGVEAATTPSDALARIALSVAAEGGGAKSEAGIFLDALSGGRGRIVVAADQFAIQAGVNSNYTPFMIEGGVVYIDKARIRDLEAENFRSNASVSIGGTGALDLISTQSGSFVNMPGMSGLTRVFDEDGVAMIFAQFGMYMSNSNQTGIIRLQNSGPNGTRFMNSGPFTYHTWDAGNRPRFINGLAVGQFSAGTHTFNFQWQRLSSGTLFCDYRRVVIAHFKRASFSGITGNSGSSGGGGGSGGGNWNQVP